MGGARWLVDGYGCGGNTYGKGGGDEERGIAQWGRRWEVDNMSCLLHLEVSWWGVSDVGVAIIVTNVRGWRRRHLVLGHVALALARVSRLKLKRFPLRQALGNMRGPCATR